MHPYCVVWCISFLPLLSNDLYVFTAIKSDNSFLVLLLAKKEKHDELFLDKFYLEISFPYCQLIICRTQQWHHTLIHITSDQYVCNMNHVVFTINAVCMKMGHRKQASTAACIELWLRLKKIMYCQSAFFCSLFTFSKNLTVFEYKKLRALDSSIKMSTKTVRAVMS